MGSSLVLGSITLVIVTLIVGLLFYSSVSGFLETMTKNHNTQTQPRALMLEWTTVNSTHITAMLENAGSKAVSISNAYVNNVPALLHLQIAPSSEEAAYISGTYQKGTTYKVKLAGLF